MNTRMHPAWYGAVMGTGALSMALSGEATAFDASWLNSAAVVFLLLTSVLAITLLPRYLRRFRDRSALDSELADPARGPMLATLPAGILVLACGWGRVGPELISTDAALWISAVLLAIGAIGAIVFSLAWITATLNAEPSLETVNGGWMIPPVMNLIVPVGLAAIMPAVPELAPALLLIGFAFYGIGAVLFVVILTMLVTRLILRAPVLPPLAASLWIPLAPCGLVGLAATRLLQSGAQAGVTFVPDIGVGVAIAAMGIGLGLWWTGFALIELRRMHRQGPLPVQPGWWGFVFPVGTMTLSIINVGLVVDEPAVTAVGALSTITLFAVWLIVSIKVVQVSRRAAKA